MERGRGGGLGGGGGGGKYVVKAGNEEPNREHLEDSVSKEKGKGEIEDIWRVQL